MKWFRGIFHDFLNNPSSGRIMALICTLMGVICWSLGFYRPALADHADKGLRAFLWAAAIFYGSAKAPEAVAYLKGNLNAVLSNSNTVP